MNAPPFSLEASMLPSADRWHDAPDGPDLDPERPDGAWDLIMYLFDRVEALEDEVARLKR